MEDYALDTYSYRQRTSFSQINPIDHGLLTFTSVALAYFTQLAHFTTNQNASATSELTTSQLGAA